jgi:hypothetical protein
MAKWIAVFVTLFSFQGLFAHDDGKPSSALAAHNALHYVDNLVARQQLEDGFVSKLKSITLTQVMTGTTLVGYQVVLAQIPGSDGKASQVEVKLDPTAKALSFVYTAGTPALNAPQWADADSITLVEDSLHYVLHHATDEKIDPFNDGLASVILSQQVQTDGTIAAVIDIKASESTETLHIVENGSGAVESATVVPLN